jgi:hypothetical protein
VHREDARSARLKADGAELAIADTLKPEAHGHGRDTIDATSRC